MSVNLKEIVTFPVYWGAGLLRFRFTEVLVYWGSGLLRFWFTEVLVYCGSGLEGSYCSHFCSSLCFFYFLAFLVIMVCLFIYFSETFFSFSLSMIPLFTNLTCVTSLSQQSNINNDRCCASNDSLLHQNKTYDNSG